MFKLKKCTLIKDKLLAYFKAESNGNFISHLWVSGTEIGGDDSLVFVDSIPCVPSRKCEIHEEGLYKVEKAHFLEADDGHAYRVIADVRHANVTFPSDEKLEAYLLNLGVLKFMEDQFCDGMLQWYETESESFVALMVNLVGTSEEYEHSVFCEDGKVPNAGIDMLMSHVKSNGIKPQKTMSVTDFLVGRRFGDPKALDIEPLGFGVWDTCNTERYSNNPIAVKASLFGLGTGRLFCEVPYFAVSERGRGKVRLLKHYSSDEAIKNLINQLSEINRIARKRILQLVDDGILTYDKSHNDVRLQHQQ